MLHLLLLTPPTLHPLLFLLVVIKAIPTEMRRPEHPRSLLLVIIFELRPHLPSGPLDLPPEPFHDRIRIDPPPHLHPPLRPNALEGDDRRAIETFSLLGLSALLLFDLVDADLLPLDADRPADVDVTDVDATLPGNRAEAGGGD